MKKNISNLLFYVMVAAILFSAAVAFQRSESCAKSVKLSVTSPSGKKVYVAKAKSVKLQVKVNKKAGNSKVTYLSKNAKIAKVSKSGVIKGIKEGTTKVVITSKANKKKKITKTIVVKKSAIKKITLSNKKSYLAIGQKLRLKAKLSPKKNVSKAVVWSTSNKKVAKVSKKGVVKARKAGTAKITVKATDGSNKKATCKVIVGVGIYSVKAIEDNIIRVTLTSKSVLKASNFIVQTRNRPTSKTYFTHKIESVTTSDYKTYDINLEEYEEISSDVYLKVTIPALSMNKSVETYIEDISGYGNSTKDTVEYVTGTIEDSNVDEDYDIYNSLSVGAMKYTLTGLPAGLKAYYNTNKTRVVVRGRYSSVQEGTVATLKGVDEKGQTFTKKYIYYIGSKDKLVSYAEPMHTMLSYIKDDPKTPKNDASGKKLDDYDIRNLGEIVGGSGSYDYNVTYNGKDLSEIFYEKVNYDDYTGYEYKTITPGQYTFRVDVKDYKNENLKTSFNVTVNLVQGVTMNGFRRDAAGQPAKEAYIYGHTKKDSNGYYYSIGNEVYEVDGSYRVRMIPGDYIMHVNVNGNSYCYSVGNIVNKNMTKNFQLPVYRVRFVTDIPNAIAYESRGNLQVVDENGSTHSVYASEDYFGKDYGLYAYLKAGKYDIDNRIKTGWDNYYGVYRAYSKLYENKLEDGSIVGSIDDSSELNESGYKLTGNSFAVNGANTITLHGTTYVAPKDDDDDDDY